eukprot:3805479-Prymnesium_polylepis.1
MSMRAAMRATRRVARRAARCSARRMRKIASSMDRHGSPWIAMDRHGSSNLPLESRAAARWVDLTPAVWVPRVQCANMSSGSARRCLNSQHV